jgi:hypothetical protein
METLSRHARPGQILAALDVVYEEGSGAEERAPPKGWEAGTLMRWIVSAAPHLSRTGLRPFLPAMLAILLAPYPPHLLPVARSAAAALATVFGPAILLGRLGDEGSKLALRELLQTP